jgi:hypothetical protein
MHIYLNILNMLKDSKYICVHIISTMVCHDMFILFLAKIIVWPWAMILLSRNNLNMGNTFVDPTEHLAKSNSEYCFFFGLP